MTSDRGYTGEAEMQLSPNPVTSKAARLNPNANVFQSKSPTSSAMHPEGKQAPDHSANSDLLTKDADRSVVRDTDQSANGGDHSDKCDVSAKADDHSAEVDDHTAKADDHTAKSDDHIVNSTRGDLSPASSTTSHGFAYMNGVDGGVSDEGVQDVAAVASSDDTPDDTPDFANMNGGPEVTAAASSSETASVTDESSTLEDRLPDDQLRAMLKNQLEYYFSRENLSNDSYLASQMDGDQFVPISTIAGFNQVKRLTNSLELVTEVLRDSSNVQVDENGLKVRPMHKRCVVILREIPDSTPLEDVANIFSGVTCPRFVSCEFAHNNSWYVTFDSEVDAQLAYQYLREEVKTFLGKPILARIKAKPLLRNSFVPKNGFKSTQHSPQQQPPQQQQQQYLPSPYNQTSQSAPPSVPLPQPSPSPQAPPVPAPQPTPPAPQQQVPPPQQQQAMPQQQNFTYPSQVPTAVHYIAQQQQFPFFPPQPAGMQLWNPVTTYFDPGSAFAANGYTPSAFNLASATHRHSFQNARNRNVKPHNKSAGGNQGERGMPSSIYRNGGPRPHSGGGGHMMQGLIRRDNHMMSAHNHMTNQRIEPLNCRGSNDGLMKDQGPRRVGYRSRRRNKGGEEEEEVKQRQHPSQTPAKEVHSQQPPGGGGSSCDSGGVSAPSIVHQPAKFELESTSFPPLPGFTNNTTTGEVFENKMSDVVKGTARRSSGSKDVKVSTPTVAACTPSVTAPTPSHPPLSSIHIVPPPPSKAKCHAAATTAEKKPVVTGAVATTAATKTVANDRLASPTVQSSNSRQKVTQSTSTDSIANDTNAAVSTSSAPVSESPLSPTAAVTSSSSTVSTQTSTKAHIKPDESKPNAARLSYAQMALRGKDRVAAAGPADKTEPAKENSVTSSASSTSESCTRSSNTLREQQSGGAHSPSRADYHRKDGIAGRRAKENREWERRGDRARVPFRERRRENRDFDAQPQPPRK